MYLNNDRNFNSFIKNFSENPQAFSTLCNEERKRTKDEIMKITMDFNNTKEELIKMAHDHFEYNTSKFKGHHTNFNYKVVQLDENSQEYTTIKQAFPEKENTVFTIYKVSQQIANQSDNVSCALLLHGTKGPLLEGILKEGFKPSRDGSKGSGVYLTNDYETAGFYGSCAVEDDGRYKLVDYIFINKLEKNDETSSFKNSGHFSAAPLSPVIEYKEGKRKVICLGPLDVTLTYEKRFLQIFDDVGEEVDFKKFSQQTDNNTFYKSKFEISKKEIRTVVAHPELVIPTYLVQVEEKKTVCELVAFILYETFNIVKFKKEPIELSCSKFDYSKENFIEEFKNEIKLNQKAKIKVIEKKFDQKLISLKEQLSVDIKKIFEAASNSSLKYKPELLTPENEDYGFVLRSIEDKNTNENPEIFKLYKIVSGVDEAQNVQGGSLYLKGVKANEVMNILNLGYSYEFEPSNSNFLNQKTSPKDSLKDCELKRQLEKGASYCLIEDSCKKLSFVFVNVCDSDSGFMSGYSDKEGLKENNSNDTDSTDSRGNYVLNGTFRGSKNDFEGSLTSAPSPAYLIIFEI